MTGRIRGGASPLAGKPRKQRPGTPKGRNVSRRDKGGPERTSRDGGAGNTRGEPEDKIAGSSAVRQCTTTRSVPPGPTIDAAPLASYDSCSRVYVRSGPDQGFPLQDRSVAVGRGDARIFSNPLP